MTEPRRLEWTAEGITFAYLVEPEELSRIIKEVLKFKGSAITKVPKTTKLAEETMDINHINANKEQDIKDWMVTTQGIKQKLAEKPNFEHTFQGIMEELTGSIVTRHNPNLYKRL